MLKNTKHYRVLYNSNQFTVSYTNCNKFHKTRTQTLSSHYPGRPHSGTTDEKLRRDGNTRFPTSKTSNPCFGQGL